MVPPTLGFRSCCSGTLKSFMRELVLGGSQPVEKQSGLVTALAALPTAGGHQSSKLFHLNSSF